MKIRNILWDTDGDREARASLPKEVELPSRFDQSHFASREEWLDTISNWLSDDLDSVIWGSMSVMTTSENLRFFNNKEK